MSASSSVVVSLANNDVYASDRALLDGPYWLNDAVVAFCMAYFQHETFAGTDSVRFAGPGAAFVVAHEDDDDDLRDTVRGMGLHGRALVLLPVNNNENVTQIGGSHWSLLARTPDGRFLAYDSMGRANARPAERLAAKLHGALAGGERKFVFEAVEDAPQQANGYDCGVYALLVARTLAQLHVDGVDVCSDRARDALVDVKQADVTKFRQEIAGYMDNLTKKKNVIDC